LLTNASREGARRAILDGATTQDVVTAVQNYLADSSIAAASVTVTPDPPSDAVSGDPVTVLVEVPFSDVSWLPSPMYLGATNLTATSVMRRESLE
jgi:hypothetical protein